jgi:hypothetical protein
MRAVAGSQRERAPPWVSRTVGQAWRAWVEPVSWERKLGLGVCLGLPPPHGVVSNGEFFGARALDDGFGGNTSSPET